MDKQSLIELAAQVAATPRQIGVLSHGERCAVALVLDDPDLMRYAYGSAIECAARLTPRELELCLQVYRERRP